MTIKLKAYKFDKILTNCIVSLKIDGVQAIKTNGNWLSRASKPLYNLPVDGISDGVYEVFLGNWELSVSAVRTIEGDPVNSEHLYRLCVLDDRLFIGNFDRMEPSHIKDLLDEANSNGDEGICIQSDQGHFKVKPVETYDVPIIGIQAGEGKNKGKMGALITPMGKVGTGFTDKQREDMKDIKIGTIIEVEVMGLTKYNKFRHPRFIRVREDKC